LLVAVGLLLVAICSLLVGFETLGGVGAMLEASLGCFFLGLTYALILLGGRGVAWRCVSSSSFCTSLSFLFPMYSPIMHSTVPMFVVGCSSLLGRVVIMVLVQLGVGQDVGGVTGVGMGMASSGGFLGGRILLSPNLWSIVAVSDDLHEAIEFRDLGAGDEACFHVAFCVDAIVKAVAIDEPAGAHFAVAFPRDSSKYVLVGKRYPPRLALGEFEFGRG
jgi:hypothetical protein